MKISMINILSALSRGNFASIEFALKLKKKGKKHRQNGLRIFAEVTNEENRPKGSKQKG